MPTGNELVKLSDLGTAFDVKADKDSITDAYSASATYAVGDYCIKDNVLYRCTTAITTAEAWTAAHWTATDVGTELKGRLKPSDVVDDLTSTATDKPLSAAQGKVLNDDIATVNSYDTLVNGIALTTSYVTYNTYNSRQLNNYYMLAITPALGNWRMGTCLIPRSDFVGGDHVAMFIYDGSNRVEVDIKYKSDTSVEAKYIGTASGNIRLHMIGMYPVL